MLSFSILKNKRFEDGRRYNPIRGWTRGFS